MAKLTPTDFQTRDIYVYFGYEKSFFRYDYKTEECFLKFVGREEFQRPHHNKLVADTVLFGIEITKEEYDSAIINPDREINPK